MPIPNAPNLNIKKSRFRVLLYVDVDGEMCVNVSHLIFETSCDTYYEVVDDCLDGTKGGDIFPCTVV